MSYLDHFFRRLLLTRFFVKGWGKPENLKRLFHFRKIISDRELCQHLVPDDYPIVIDKEEIQDECRIFSGHFMSPFTEQLPGIMPKEVQTARFQMILPKEWNGSLKPICVHLAGTGDHGFRRRRQSLARPMLKEYNIASVILENPYYGVRKPKSQFRSQLNNVSDLFVMGGALVLESIALFHWLESWGFGPLGISGISMGGHNIFSQSMVLGTIDQLLVGVLRGAIPWNYLQKEFLENDIYGSEINKLIHSPERSGRTKTEAYLLGQRFHKYYDEHCDTESSIDKSYNSQNDEKSLYTIPSSTLSLAANPIHSGSSQCDSPIISSQKYSTLALKNQQVLQSGQRSKSTVSSQIRSWNPLSLLKDFQRGNGQLPEDALDFMRGVMDECTHLGNFSVPVDPELIIIVSAKQDAYIPHNNVMSLAELWPGCNVRYINRGHIGAFLWDKGVFRAAIKDSFDLQIAKYYNNNSNAQVQN